ncbi:MAG: hypothetical protein HFI75_06120 [Lachnospiraceae bacterium]|nr:hypothetical protein [Lachnospiraceae bacterium]
MEWEKFNWDEVAYYCKSTKSLAIFHCGPLSFQLEEMLGIFWHYDIRSFQLEDLQRIYSVLQIPKMKSEGILLPSPGKLRTILERLAAKNKVILELPDYVITDVNKDRSEIYRKEIDEGYQKDYISGWITYEKEHSILKREFMP